MATTDDLLGHFADRARDYGQLSPWVDDRSALAPIADAVASQRPDSVLELGSGSGAVPRFLSSVDLQAPLYVGLDASHAMLLEQAGPAERVVGDAALLPIASQSIDLVVCRQAFHYFSRPLPVLSEVTRVLASHGVLLIAQIVPFDEVDDRRWWKAAVALRQPLRRHRWTASAFIEILHSGGFSSQQTTYVEGRSSLANWIGRYPISANARRALIHHFHHTPASVRERRGFVVSSTDIEYTIRWLILTAVVDPHGKRDGLATSMRAETVRGAR